MAAVEDQPETRERQVSSYEDLNGLTFGALKRLASENGIRLAKFPKKHDIIKQILIQAEESTDIAAAIVEAVPSAPHVSNPPTPERQSSTETATRPQPTKPLPQPQPSIRNDSSQQAERKRVGFANEEKEEKKERNDRTPSQQARFTGARGRAETTAIMSDTHRNKPLPANPKKPPLKTSVTMGDVMHGRHRPRASSLPAKATLNTAELFGMNFTQLKHHALNLGLEIPRVPTKGKILRMILAYQPDDFDADLEDDDSESEDAVKGEEKEEKEDEEASREESPPTEVPAAPAATQDKIVHEENKPSDLMAMWRSKSHDSNNGAPSQSANENGPQPKKKSNLMSMWQERADAGKTPPPQAVSSGPRKGSGAVSKFAQRLANENIAVGPPPNRAISSSPKKSVTPSPRSNEDDATEQKEAVPQKSDNDANIETTTVSPTPATSEPAPATEEKKEADEDEASSPPQKTREELDAMGFKALKKYITGELGLSLPRVPNRGNCIKAILKHQSGETDEEPAKRTIKLKPKPKPKDMASQIGGTSIADRLKMIAASQANHGVPPTGGGTGDSNPAPKKMGKVSGRFGAPNEETKTDAPADERPRPRPKKKKIGKIGKIGGMGMAINIAALRPGARPKPRARSGSMVTTQMEFDNLELLRPTIQSGRRKSRIRGPGRSDAAQRILVEVDED